MSGDSLRHKLDQLHEATVDAISSRLTGQVDEDGNPVGPSSDDLRLAMQLLKQNNITAPAIPDTPTALMARMAGKLDFMAVQRKLQGQLVLKPSSEDAVRPRMPFHASAGDSPSPESR